jgi:hypothetical protein
VAGRLWGCCRSTVPGAPAGRVQAHNLRTVLVEGRTVFLISGSSVGMPSRSGHIQKCEALGAPRGRTWEATWPPAPDAKPSDPLCRRSRIGADPNVLFSSTNGYAK